MAHDGFWQDADGSVGDGKSHWHIPATPLPAVGTLRPW